MLDERAIADPDLSLLEDRRHRHHDGELPGVALEVVGHGDDRLVLVADQNHLRGLVEELRIGLGHVESAERQYRGRREGDHEHRGHEYRHELHASFLSPRRDASAGFH